MLRPMIWAGFILYLVVVFAVGLYSYRRNRTQEDFLLAGRRLGPWIASVSERASGESAWLLLGLPGATFAAAYGQTWAAVGSIDVMDDGIIPGARIEVQAINCVCDTGPSGNYSAALDVRMSIWGDVVGNNFDSLLPGRWDPPQGVIDFNDISSVVDKFRNLPGAPLKARVDISPNVPDLVIDFVDISRCVDAFRGDAYPFAGPSARGPLNEAPDAR